MFDAGLSGAIEARLVVNLDQFSKDMDRAEARVKRFTDKVYRVRIAAVFDESSIGRARAMFASLDNSLSKDAMSRLRSSPQGSVLGTLNALFSPHPVTGAPTAQQAAQQGLLGKMISGSGGGVGQTVQRNIIRDVIGVNDAQVKAEGARAGREAADAAQKAATAESKRKGGLVTNLIEKTTTEQTRTITTKNVVRDVLGVDETKARAEGAKAGKDAADAAAAEAVKEGGRRQGLLGGLLAGVGSLGGRLGGLLGGGGGGKGGGSILAGLLGGIGPGVTGVGAKVAGGVGIGGGLLGAIPALAAIAAGVGVLGIGLKSATSQTTPLVQALNQAQLALSQATTPAQTKAAQAQIAGVTQAVSQLTTAQQSLFKSQVAISNTMQDLGTSIAPLFAKGLAGLASLLQSISPLLKQTFAAAAPLLTPLINGLGMLLQGLLPGLISLLKAAMPAFQALSQVLGTLGRDVGSMLASFAPVIAASSTIFKALADVLAALFPIVGKLAAVFASALAPVFVEFAGVIKALLPVLTIIGKILVGLAGAVLTDLVAAFGALAQLLKAVAPSFTVLANALSSVFAVLENSGVFAVFGNALESIVPILAKLINTLIMGLAPVLPVIIQAVGQLASLLAAALAAGLNALLIALIPIIGWLAKLTVSLIDWLQSSKLLMPVLLAVAAVLAGPVVVAVVALIAAIGLAATHWKQIWTDIKNWTDDFIKFMVGLFDSLPGPVKQVLTAIWDSWKVTWDIIKAYVTVLWAALKAEFTIVFDAIAAIFKVVLDLMTGNWRGAWNAIKAFADQVWNALKAAGDTIWNAIKNDLGAALGAMKAEWMAVWNAISGAATALWNGLKAALAGVMGALANSWTQGWGQIIGFAKSVPGKIIGALAALAGDMVGIGKDAIGGLLGGITAALSGIASWVNNNIVQPIINAVKHFFGINSPSTVMAGIGGHLVSGLIKGLITSGSGLGAVVSKVFGGMPTALLSLIEKGIVGVSGLPGKAVSALKGLGSKALSVLKSLGADAADLWTILFGGGGAGVSQWSGVAAHALALLNQPLSDLGIVMAQMQTESGGNPTIVNKWDSNWLAGHPSVGLMQVIQGTFDAYAGPFRNTGPFEYGVSVDPLANVYAGLNYAIHAYPDWTAVLGHGHGYALGGMIMEPIVGFGVRSGQKYTLGERGPEYVTPLNKMNFARPPHHVGTPHHGIIPGVGHLGEGGVPGTMGGGGGGWGGIIHNTVKDHLHRLHVLHEEHLHHLHELHLKHLAHLKEEQGEGGGGGSGAHHHGKRIVIVGHQHGPQHGVIPGGRGEGGTGGPFIPGVGHLGEGPVPGATPGWVQQLLDKLDTLTHVTAQVPAAVGDHVGGAIGGAAYSASFRARYPRGGA